MQNDNQLLYLSNSGYGGWVSFTYHLCKILEFDYVAKIGKSFNGGGIFYGDLQYGNIPVEALPHFGNPIITAVDKAHYHVLNQIKTGTIVIHDPTELSEPVIEFARSNRVITIRKTVSDLLNSMGITNQFLKHPFYRYDKIDLPKMYNRALSRVDFDKNTNIICKANQLGADIEIHGYRNHIYYFHELKELDFDKYYKGAYSKKLSDISALYAGTKYLVDLSTIKKDGGGTQYTFLEAEHHDCSLILHKDWVNVSGSEYQDGVNCYAVGDEHELLSALSKPVIKSNCLPSEEQNEHWKQILK